MNINRVFVSSLAFVLSVSASYSLQLNQTESDITSVDSHQNTRHDLISQVVNTIHREPTSTEIAFLKVVPESQVSTVIGLLPKSTAQLNQDLFVLSELGFKKNGFFVEFGAADGLELSNSFLLETEFDWQGILAEPAKLWHQALFSNRKCAIDTQCVWTQSGETLSFTQTNYPVLSTISNFSDCDHLREQRKEGQLYDVQTISLIDLLKKYNAPYEIEYLSIDTEGSEYDILNAFDFDAYNIKIITCEHNHTINREKIYNLLSSKGYERKYINASKWDDWYVRRSYKGSLDSSSILAQENIYRLNPLFNSAPPKAPADDVKGRYREIISDPLNILINRVSLAGLATGDCIYVHNGNKVLKGSYYGSFSDILLINRGVHEPLEEFVFQEILNRGLNYSEQISMIELGSYWAHYSMWLKLKQKHALTICVEPEASNLEFGKRNYAINGYEGIFIQDFVSNDRFQIDRYMQESHQNHLHILHSDIQGYECQMLDGASDTLSKQQVDYIMISTHSDFLHNRVTEQLQQYGYRIDISANFNKETTSYDGFILGTHPRLANLFEGMSFYTREEISLLSAHQVLQWYEKLALYTKHH